MSMTCAIHQPNLFPRLSTLAKLYEADIWVVLDNVQFAARDYQHRARLAPLGNPYAHQWLSLPVHRPHGRASLITDLQLVDAAASRHHVELTLRHLYGRGPYWPMIQPAIQEVLSALGTTDRLADVAEVSTLALLRLVGWRGQVVRSSDLLARTERPARLADLTAAVGAGQYLCGSGGARYIDETPFRAKGIRVRYFHLPEHGIWAVGRKVSALWPLATCGPEAIRAGFEASAVLDMAA